ncbi:MAG: hypothetical protein Q4D51_14280 [Eubacteriales bacterium]|nr:hypothetical protein [Eubacteriales bacterium]
MANFNISSFFNNSNSGAFGSFNFAEYASIKNGTYRKLVKANYKMQKSVSSDKTEKTEDKKKNQKVSTTDTTGMTKLKTEVDSLKTTATDLSKDDLWKQKNGSYDMDKISKAVKDFAKEYNNVIEQTGKVKSKDVSLQTSFMKSLTNTMSNSLSKIGVSVDDDGKMTVDEEALKKANVKDIKSVMSGKYSYAGQVADKASAISSAALRNSGTYGSSGSWSSSLSGMFDQWM